MCLKRSSPISVRVAVRNLRSQDGPVGTFLLVAPMIAGPGPAADEVRLVVPPIAQDVLEQVLESRHATNSGRGIGAGGCREEHRLALAVASVSIRRLIQGNRSTTLGADRSLESVSTRARSWSISSRSSARASAKVTPRPQIASSGSQMDTDDASRSPGAGANALRRPPGNAGSRSALTTAGDTHPAAMHGLRLCSLPIGPHCRRELL